MKKHLFVMLIIVSLCVFACQTGKKTDPAAEISTGIQFQTMSLVDAAAQAKAQNKLIMVDFYSPT